MVGAYYRNFTVYCIKELLYLHVGTLLIFTRMYFQCSQLPSSVSREGNFKTCTEQRFHRTLNSLARVPLLPEFFSGSIWNFMGSIRDF